MRFEVLLPLIASSLVLQTVAIIGQQQQHSPLPVQQQSGSQNQQQQEQAPEQINLPLNPQNGDSSRGLWPMVTVDKQDNKSTVDVHVPIVFDMNHQRDPQNGKSRLDLSVLQGLVTVSRDKAKQENGQVSGPLTVTVFGIPVYTGLGSRRASFADRVNDAIESRRRAFQEQTVTPLARTAEAQPSATTEISQTANQLASQISRTSDRVIKSLSGFLDRLSGIVKSHVDSSSSLAASPTSKSAAKGTDKLADNTGVRAPMNSLEMANNPAALPVDNSVELPNSQSPKISSRSRDLMKRFDVTTEKILTLESSNPRALSAKEAHEELIYV